MTATDDDGTPERLQAEYRRGMSEIRSSFESSGDGARAVKSRSELVDNLVRELSRLGAGTVGPGEELALIAVGGYGRQQLFPGSDVDLLFCTEKTASPAQTALIRKLSQHLWDCGIRLASFTRTVTECERFHAEDPEWDLALLDMRFLTGDAAVFARLRSGVLEERRPRDLRSLVAAVGDLTQERHTRFGNTLFHLEPNVKDGPGGLRDGNICTWLRTLRGEAKGAETEAFAEAFRFLTDVRGFLHLRHGRDDNTLDWHSQDEAAAQAIGLGPRRAGAGAPDAAYWMRVFFRHARSVQRTLAYELELSGQKAAQSRATGKVKVPTGGGYYLQEGALQLKQSHPELDPATDPELVLQAFATVAETGVSVAPESEARITEAIPALSLALEDGPRLWMRLRPVLTGRFAAQALRVMHALGFLELILPEFHGIDALVIRDAYHRYTVDEHTFVLIEAIHSLADAPPREAPEWRTRFCNLVRDLPHPELLFLAALLHDTGKGRASSDHARVSARLAEEVCRRLEIETYDSSVVVRLIRLHLEMSAALRRDIFDKETVRAFAEKVGGHDLLRMLTLFTYADITAVHPDALTPWKAENLWRLYMAAANHLDRSVDEERVHIDAGDSASEAASLGKALGLARDQQSALEHFLEGIPERYLRTRSPHAIRQQMQISLLKGASPVLIQLGREVHEVTIVTQSRPRLFANLAASLSSWGMNIVSAEAYSNAHGTVVDTFRFTDAYRTLELNPEERERFRDALEAVVRGETRPEHLNRRRGNRASRPRRKVETRIDFDNTASSHSTLLQVIAQDKPGLLHAVSLALSEAGYDVEVALIDTEGEMAIDVFYITRDGEKADESGQAALRRRLEEALRPEEGQPAVQP